MFKERFRRTSTVLAYANITLEPFKRALGKIAYAYMFKEPFKQALTIIAYAYTCRDIPSYHGEIGRSAVRYQSTDLTIISIHLKFQLHIYQSFREKQF